MSLVVLAGWFTFIIGSSLAADWYEKRQRRAGNCDRTASAATVAEK